MTWKMQLRDRSVRDGKSYGPGDAVEVPDELAETLYRKRGEAIPAGLQKQLDAAALPAAPAVPPVPPVPPADPMKPPEQSDLKLLAQELGITEKQAEALAGAGYTEPEHLAMAADEDLLRVPGISKKAIESIRKALSG